MIKNRGLAFRLILMLISYSVVIFSLILIYNYYVSKRIIIKNLEENARNLALATVNRMESVLQPVQKVPRYLASVLEEQSVNSEADLLKLLQRSLEDNSEIFGLAAAFQPNSFLEGKHYFAPYYYRDAKSGKILLTYLGDDDYNYYQVDWYQLPLELKRPVWSEPYFDIGGTDILMSTYSVPLYRRVDGKKEFWGVVTADISLEWLRELVSSIKIYQTGYGFLVSKNGTIITHPNRDLIMNETIFSVAEEKNDPRLREIGRLMVRGHSGFVPIENIVNGEKSFLAYEPMPSSGWSLGVFFPEYELMADLRGLTHTVIILIVLGLIFIGLIIVVVTEKAIKPLRYLNRVIHQIGGGNLEVEIPEIKTRDEVGELAHSFSTMQISLRDYIQRLKETTAAKERIEGELQVARDIQLGILPRVFPPFPERKEFDLYALMEPAKEVGGDLYDFFFMDDNALCLCIGDVSGKGVPAALFMAVTKTLVKAKMTKGLSPAIGLTRVNEDLCLDNPSAMFVTMFLAILDTQTGELSYSLGGHNLPYILRADGQVEQLEKTKGAALGVMNKMTFEGKKVVLKPGDILFTYTDGVNEAMNERDEQYDYERMLNCLKSSVEMHPKAICSKFLASVKKFTGDAPQSDDITILAVKYNSGDGKSRLKLS